jgi:hypothetical protein
MMPGDMLANAATWKAVMARAMGSLATEQAAETPSSTTTALTSSQALTLPKATSPTTHIGLCASSGSMFMEHGCVLVEMFD